MPNKIRHFTTPSSNVYLVVYYFYDEVRFGRKFRVSRIILLPCELWLVLRQIMVFLLHLWLTHVLMEGIWLVLSVKGQRRYFVQNYNLHIWVNFWTCESTFRNTSQTSQVSFVSRQCAIITIFLLFHMCYLLSFIDTTLFQGKKWVPKRCKLFEGTSI